MAPVASCQHAGHPAVPISLNCSSMLINSGCDPEAMCSSVVMPGPEMPFRAKDTTQELMTCCSSASLQRPCVVTCGGHASMTQYMVSCPLNAWCPPTGTHVIWKASSAGQPTECFIWNCASYTPPVWTSASVCGQIVTQHHVSCMYWVHTLMQR